MEDDVILSVHLPKTGGTTLFSVFQQAYGSGLVADYPDRDPWAAPQKERSRISRVIWPFRRSSIDSIGVRTDPVTLIHGHFELKAYLDLAPHPRVVTFLREPLSRALSHFFYWKNPPPDEPLDNPIYVKYFVEREPNLEEFLLAPELVNVMAKLLEPFDRPEQFFFIGLHERFSDDLRMLLQKLDISTVTWGWRNMGPPGGRVKIQEDVRRAFYALHDRDTRLYKAALEYRPAGRREAQCFAPNTRLYEAALDYRHGESVSVVIVNYNAGRFLTDCVRAALPQTGEVLVVDNASTDFSVDLCLEHFTDDPKLKIIRNDTNMGFAAACNIGSKQAKGGYVLFLNPDCSLDGRAVDELVRVLEADNSVGMAGGLIINPDGSEQAGGRRAVPTPWRSLVRAFGLSRFANRWPQLFSDFYLHRQALPDKPIEVEAISGACMLVKRDVMEHVGLWDEGYFLHCEDLDWCMRFRQKGWKIMFVPGARVTHWWGVCSQGRPVFVEWHKHKGMMRFYRKFFRHEYPGALMGLVAIGVWIRFGCVASYYGVKRAVQTVGLGRG